MKDVIRDTNESLAEVKKAIVMEIEVNKSGEIAEGLPRNTDG